MDELQTFYFLSKKGIQKRKILIFLVVAFSFSLNGRSSEVFNPSFIINEVLEKIIISLCFTTFISLLRLTKQSGHIVT